MPLGSVAVDVMNWPGVTATAKNWLIVALFPTVVNDIDPRNVWPSPLPEGSQVGFEKNSTRKAVLAVLFKVPWIVIAPALDTADASTGKFCRSFGPVSGSLRSLGVTPLLPRSIPSLPLE